MNLLFFRIEWLAPFSGGADHVPVCLEWWSKATWMKANDGRVPKGRRSDGNIVKASASWYEVEIDWYLQETRRAVTQRELDAAYTTALRCWLRPWNRVRAKDRPEQWGKHWIKDLQKMSQHRRVLWKRWKQNKDMAARTEHRRLDKKIKRRVRYERRRCYLGKAPVNETVGILSRMLRSKQRRSNEQTEAVQRITPSEFTAFVAHQHSRRLGECRLSRALFELDDD